MCCCLVWDECSIVSLWDECSIVSLWDECSILSLWDQCSILSLWDQCSIVSLWGRSHCIFMGEILCFFLGGGISQGSPPFCMNPCQWKSYYMYSHLSIQYHKTAMEHPSHKNTMEHPSHKNTMEHSSHKDTYNGALKSSHTRQQHGVQTSIWEQLMEYLT